MLSSINFLRDRRRRLTKQQALDRKIFKFSMIAGGICLSIFLATLGIRLFFVLTQQQLMDREDQLLATIRSQEENERSYVIFAAKLKVLSELFESRRDKQEALQYFTTLFGPNILISDVNYDATGSVLTLGLQAKDVFTLQTIFDLLKSEDVQSQFSSIKTSDLRRNDQGSYVTNVTISLR